MQISSFLVEIYLGLITYHKLMTSVSNLYLAGVDFITIAYIEAFYQCSEIDCCRLVDSVSYAT